MTIAITYAVDETPAVQNIRFVAGQDLSIALTVTNTDGTVYDLTDCTATSEFVDPDTGTSDALTVTTNTSTGVITATLTDVETAALGAVRRLWHVTLAGAVNRVLIRGVAIIEGHWG